MLLSLSQFESFENRRSEMASSSLHSQKSGGTNLIGGVSSIYIFAWKRSSRVLSLLRSQFWVLRFGFSVLGSRTGRDVRKLEIEEHKSHRETQTHTHSHTLVKGSPGTRLRFRGLRNEKGQLAQRQAQMNRNEARCSHRNSS